MTTAPPLEARISANVAAALRDADRTVASAARLIGVPRTTLAHQIKTGRFPVSVLLRLAFVIGCRVEDLVSDRDAASETTFSAEVAA